MAGSGILFTDEVVGHKAHVRDQGHYLLPVDRLLERVPEGACREADLRGRIERVTECLQEGGEMIPVSRAVGMPRVTGYRRVFPVDVDAIGMEIAGRGQNRPGE